MKKFLLFIATIALLTGCTSYSQRAVSSYSADASSFNGGIPATQDISALRKQVVVTGLQNEVVKNNADSQNAILGVADHRLGVEGHAERNRHEAIRNRLNEVRGTTNTIWNIKSFINSF